jgi:hypothetical protein
VETHKIYLSKNCSGGNNRPSYLWCGGLYLFRGMSAIFCRVKGFESGYSPVPLMTTLSQPAERAGSDHPPARSRTPAAWMALGLVAVLVAGWMFADQLLCVVVRTGASVWAWKRGETLRIRQLDFDGAGSLRATGVEWSRGAGEHRSMFRCDMALLTPSPLRDLIFPKSGHNRQWVRELWLARTRLLLDSRGEAKSAGEGLSHGDKPFSMPSILLPGSLYAGPAEVVWIGENGRIALHDLRLDLPSGWTGRITFHGAEADLGAEHRMIPAGAARAYWEQGALRIGSLSLGEGLSLGELSLRLMPGRLDFGLRGMIGKGLIRGDGSFGGKNNLEITLVGEQLALDGLKGWHSGSVNASGTIDQVRLSFRGDPHKPMDAVGSVRLVGRNFRWDGRGWESLRLAASMTGRNLTLSQLSLRQGENELVAEGRSSLPGDWRALLRAPFTANFRASLTDAGSLASLFGPEASLLGGSLYLEGTVRGADNKAEGYCNFSGLGTKFRRLTLDWVKGCLLFEGPATRIPYAEAAAGTDRMALSNWTVENSRPHAYSGEAKITVKDLARRLGEIGVPVAASIGAGALTGTWKGGGEMNAHHGVFEVRFTEWISRWTTGGISGIAEGMYDPSALKLNKVQMNQDDLTLSLGINATRQRLDITSIGVTKGASKKPLATGEISLPLDVLDLWTGGEPVKTLAMEQPVNVGLTLEGLRVEQLAELLGQKATSSGKLGGWITATGTPAAPVLQGSIQATGFSPGTGSPAGDLSAVLGVDGGETKITIHQENGTTAMDGECTLALRLGKSSGALVPEGTSKLAGALRLRKLPLDGWITLLSGATPRPAHGIIADGEATISGTVGQPQSQGRLLMTVGRADISGSQQLSNLALPLVFSNATTTLGDGTAKYRGEPVTLSGTADWAAGLSSPNISLRIGGTNLPVMLPYGLAATAKADLTLSVSAGAAAVLAGTLQLDPLHVDLSKRLVPAFSPPGLSMAAAQQAASVNAESARGTQWNLDLATVPDLPAWDGPGIAVKMHLTGSPENPRVEGNVTTVNQTILVPGGCFDLPAATISFTGEGSKLSGTATGLTKAGFGSLQLGGSLESPEAAFDAGTGITAADWILACATAQRAAAPPALLAFSWLRQQMLLPVPAKLWSTRPQASMSATSDPAALGFYGTPWVWNFSNATPAESGEPHAR